MTTESLMRWFRAGPWRKMGWVQILAALLTGCVNLDK